MIIFIFIIIIYITMISNFTYFLYNNNLNDYMNCYSTFLMTRKDLKDNILNHRMNLLINYYTNEEKLEQINRQKLIQYYISSYKDNYIKPSLDIDANDNNNNNNNDDNNNDVDVEDHYKYMFVNTKPKPPVIDYDEIDKEYALKLELEEEEKQREKEIQLENDYDDYYDDDENYDILNDDFSDEDNIEYDYSY